MFDTLWNAAKLATNIAALPVSVAADALTLGGELTDRRESYTSSKTRKIGRDAKGVLDDIAG